MTEPTQNKETLREAVAFAIFASDFHPDDLLNGTVQEKWNEWPEDWRKAFVQADAAIATMSERLRTPSEEMLKAGEHAWMNRDLNDPASHPIRDCFRAMLTAFQQENSDA